MKIEALMLEANVFDAYTIVGNIIIKEVEKIHGNYQPYAIIVFLKIDDCIMQELLMTDPMGDYVWDMDWWEGEREIELLGFTVLDDMKTPEHKL